MYILPSFWGDSEKQTTYYQKPNKWCYAKPVGHQEEKFYVPNSNFLGKTATMMLLMN